MINDLSMRFITRIDNSDFSGWYVRVGLTSKDCQPKLFPDNKYGSINASSQLARSYRNSEEKRLKSKYNIKFNNHINPKKESVWFSCYTRKSGTEYCQWIASVWDYKKKKQHKKCYSINKYGTREAKRLAYEWRNQKRSEINAN